MRDNQLMGTGWHVNRPVPREFSLNRGSVRASGFMHRVRVCIVAVCMVVAMSFCLRALLLPGSKDWAFDRMMGEWTANVRTNMTVETTLRFRDEVVVPFVRREMPNPFALGGAEAAKPWAKEAEHVYEVGLRNVCDDYWSLWDLDHRNCRKAGDLVERGCDEPFIMALSLFDSRLQWWFHENKVLFERLAAVEKKLNEKQGAGFLRVLVAYFRCRLTTRKWDDVHVAFRKWVQERGFGKNEEIPLLHLSKVFNIPADDPVMKRPEFRWMHDVASVKPTINKVLKKTGDGTPRAIGASGWKMLENGGGECGALIKDAEGIRPGRVETLSALFYAMCISRTGSAADKDSLFTAISEKRIDDRDTLVYYISRRLAPRWGGSHRIMLRFAKACYETQRHDTILPYLYAETQCHYVRDTVTDPVAYFGGKPMVAEKCIDVCMRQTTNEFACSRARLLAPFIGAAVAFYARRYEDAAKFSPYFPVFLDGNWLDVLFFDKDKIKYAVQSFSSDHSALCIRLQRMCDNGNWRESLAEIDKLPKKVYNDFAVKHFLHTLALEARINTDFADGKDVKGVVPPFFPGWWNTGWWCCSDWTWETYGGFSWDEHLTWRAPLPKAHELEITLSPKPKTNGRHILVVSRFVYEEPHYRPLNGIPFVTLIWEKDRTGVIVGNDYYNMFNVDAPDAAPDAGWAKAQGDERRIRIVVNGDGGLEVYVGDTERPVVSTYKYADAINRSPETCHARFRGDNVRISNITVRKPRH